MFEKIKVNGKDTHILWQLLKTRGGRLCGAKIRWNYTKFLVNREGVVYKRYGIMQNPLSFEGDIKKLLYNQSVGKIDATKCVVTEITAKNIREMSG